MRKRNCSTVVARASVAGFVVGHSVHVPSTTRLRQKCAVHRGICALCSPSQPVPFFMMAKSVWASAFHPTRRACGPSFWAACLTLLARAALPISAQTPSTGISLTVTPDTVVEGNDATVLVAIGASRTEDVSVYVLVEPVAPALLADYLLLLDYVPGAQFVTTHPDTEEIEFAISAGSTESSRTDGRSRERGPRSRPNDRGTMWRLHGSHGSRVRLPVT